MLSEKQWEAIELLEKDPAISTVLYGGAAGGGKSFLGNFWQISRRIWHPDTAGLIGRDSLVNLKKTTLVTFFRIWQKYFSYNPQGITIKPDGQTNTINFSNGSRIYLKGLAHNSSDPEGTDYGSLELTDAFIDEVNGCSKKYVDIVESRIRYNLINDKSPILLAANPGYDWVRDRFVKDKAGNPKVLQAHEAVVRALLSDNPDPKFQENYRRQLEKLPPYDRQRLLDGDWDAVQMPDNPFLYAFDQVRHVKPVQFNPNLPVYVSIDFNINPFCAIFAQINGRQAWVYDEVAIPNGDLEKLCRAISDRVPEVKRGMLRITGDAMGKRGEISVRGNHSNYAQIQRMLNLSHTQFLLRGNPTHENSRADCNAALTRLDIFIDPKCTGTINDCKNVAADGDGNIVKQNRDRMEQRADFLDCFRYLVNAYLKQYL